MDGSHSLDVFHQSKKAIVATCNLNQWALDFDGNLSRVIESIRIAKQKGARFRLGPELEISGYSCEDHFLELDTYLHCDQSLAAILSSDITDGILCDIGCPMMHGNVRYNCRLFCLNRKILLIRPKVYLADDGNYREKRFFTSWDFRKLDNPYNNAASSPPASALAPSLEAHFLSDLLQRTTGQEWVPIGVAAIRVGL